MPVFKHKMLYTRSLSRLAQFIPQLWKSLSAMIHSFDDVCDGQNLNFWPVLTHVSHPYISAWKTLKQSTGLVPMIFLESAPSKPEREAIVVELSSSLAQSVSYESFNATVYMSMQLPEARVLYFSTASTVTWSNPGQLWQTLGTTVCFCPSSVDNYGN